MRPATNNGPGHNGRDWCTSTSLQEEANGPVPTTFETCRRFSVLPLDKRPKLW